MDLKTGSSWGRGLLLFGRCRTFRHVIVTTVFIIVHGLVRRCHTVADRFELFCQLSEVFQAHTIDPTQGLSSRNSFEVLEFLTPYLLDVSQFLFDKLSKHGVLFWRAWSINWFGLGPAGGDLIDADIIVIRDVRGDTISDVTVGQFLAMLAVIWNLDGFSTCLAGHGL